MTRYRRLFDRSAAQPEDPQIAYQLAREWQSEHARFEPLLNLVVSVYCSRGSIDYGDYQSAARDGLQRALLKAQTPFLLAGFARVCITHSVVDYHRKRMKQLARERLDGTL